MTNKMFRLICPTRSQLGLILLPSLHFLVTPTSKFWWEKGSPRRRRGSAGSPWYRQTGTVTTQSSRVRSHE